MKRALAFIDTVAAEIAQRTANLGARVNVDASVLDRSDSIALAPPGARSANGSCRLLRTQDGWIAANLPRADDLAAVPALLETPPEGDPWAMLVVQAREMPAAALIARAETLGLALAAVGETKAPAAPCDVAVRDSRTRSGALRVVDFSSLWAGPLCGSVFAAMGAEVEKIESTERPDTTQVSAPLLDQRLNGAKRRRRLALSTAEGRAALIDAVARCDVLITSARARALDVLDLSRSRIFAANPELVWIAMTGHGWASSRIAFGDDAAASGGLIAWEHGEPRFIGDAIADPLTGLGAANAALSALGEGHGAFIDAALARTAAYVAASPA